MQGAVDKGRDGNVLFQLKCLCHDTFMSKWWLKFRQSFG